MYVYRERERHPLERRKHKKIKTKMFYKNSKCTPWDSSVGIETGYGLDDRMIRVKFPGGGLGIFFFDTISIPALGPT
jgi:hypothetical protein